ncbi:MAG: hypothetical protein PHV74_15550 [Dehalococcoidia bacterium]|nr:hypothetical protein [Dehalococcoidia bacterium]
MRMFPSETIFKIAPSLTFGLTEPRSEEVDDPDVLVHTLSHQMRNRRRRDCRDNVVYRTRNILNTAIRFDAQYIVITAGDEVDFAAVS